MPKSSKATEVASKAGFTLIEALVALAVAAAALPAISSGFKMAWSRARIAEESAAGMNLARSLVARGLSRPGLPAQVGASRGFDFSVAAEPLRMEGRASSLPPPLPETRPKLKPKPGRASAALRRAGLRRIVVAVVAPSGRRLLLETVKAQPAPQTAAK